MTTIYLIRHGEVDNPDNILYGRTDIPLTEHGKEQLRSLSEKLKSDGVKPDIIFSSPMYRTQQSSKEIQKVFPDVDIKYEDDLAETECGTLLGKSLTEIQAMQDIYKNKVCLDAGLEPQEKVTERMFNVYQNAIKEYKNKTVFLVSHGDPLALLYFKLLYPSDPAPSIVDLTIQNQKYLEKGMAWKITVD